MSHLLLAAGGVLVVIAAVVFAAVNWSSLGPGGRAAILLAASAALLVLAWALARRALAATAESVAGVGLAMTAADIYLVAGLVEKAGVRPLTIAAMACAVLAVGWAAYGWLAGLRGPGLAAIMLGQAPLPLAALAAWPRPASGAFALLLDSVGSMLVAQQAVKRNRRAEALAARAAAVATWTAAVVMALGWLAGPLIRLIWSSSIWGSAVVPPAVHVIPATTAVLASAAALCWQMPWGLYWGRALGIGVGALAGASIPAVAGLTGPAGLAVLTAEVAMLLVVFMVVRDRLAAGAAAAAAVALAAGASAWSLATRAATVAELGVLAAAFVLAVAGARWESARAAMAPIAVIWASAFVLAAVLAAGLAARPAAFVVQACGALALLVAAGMSRADRGGSASLAVEVSGWTVVGVGVLMTADDAETTSVALATAGGICLLVALRPDRRSAVWAALALADASLAVAFAAANVTAPEAYTVPAAATALGYGWSQLRRSPQLNSWLVYGPGLALGLLPSLAAAWTDTGWPRPLLLGGVAAGLTLAGARNRLGAVLLSGAAVLVAVGGHELAPQVRQLLGALPRWVPIALAGVVLIVVGATYEARLRDLARIRRGLASLR